MDLTAPLAGLLRLAYRPVAKRGHHNRPHAAPADARLLDRRAGCNRDLRPDLGRDRDRQALSDDPGPRPSAQARLRPLAAGAGAPAPARTGTLAARRSAAVRCWRWWRLAVALLIRSEAAVQTYHQSAADARERGLPEVSFHFDHSSKMKVSRPPGAYVKAERQLNGTLAGSFTVGSFELAPEQGLVSGFMPIVATKFERRAARRYDHFRLVFEGRARVNDVEGYQFAFTARLTRPDRPARQLFGRIVMLPRPYDTGDPNAPYPEGQSPRDGVLITMLATTLDKVPSATRVGDEGILQTALPQLPLRRLRRPAGPARSLGSGSGGARARLRLGAGRRRVVTRWGKRRAAALGRRNGFARPFRIHRSRLGRGRAGHAGGPGGAGGGSSGSARLVDRLGLCRPAPRQRRPAPPSSTPPSPAARAAAWRPTGHRTEPAAAGPAARSASWSAGVRER